MVDSIDRETYLIARALYLAIKYIKERPDDEQATADRAGMADLLAERYREVSETFINGDAIALALQMGWALPLADDAEGLEEIAESARAYIDLQQSDLFKPDAPEFS